VITRYLRRNGESLESPRPSNSSLQTESSTGGVVAGFAAIGDAGSHEVRNSLPARDPTPPPIQEAADEEQVRCGGEEDILQSVTEPCSERRTSDRPVSTALTALLERNRSCTPTHLKGATR
jgi:hypothetical protein